MSENWDIEPDNSEIDEECEKAITRCWEESEIKKLADHLGSGKVISRNDLAKILRVTFDAEIPMIVRIAIANLLDEDVKTGRGRPHTYFESDKKEFRNKCIKIIYKDLRSQKTKNVDAMNIIADIFDLDLESVRSIVTS